MTVEKVSNDALTPLEMAKKAETIGVNKAHLPFDTMFVLAIWAGIFIGLAAVFANTISTGLTGVFPFGMIKLVSGLVFCLGLVLVVVGGAELFTGNILIVMAWVDGKVELSGLLRNWTIVYIGNFVGSIMLAGLMVLSKQYTFASGGIGANMLNTALFKIHLDFWQALGLATVCNILVCLAVWMTYSARTVVDKVAIIILPITAFVAGGFEHSVANMYFIPVALFLKQFDPAFIVKSAIDVADLTWSNFLVHNLFPVTIGNILGGVFVGLMYWYAYLLPLKRQQ